MSFFTNVVAVGATAWLGGTLTVIPFFAIAVATWLVFKYAFGISDLFPFGCIGSAPECGVLAPIFWIVVKLHLYGLVGSVVLATIWGVLYASYEKITSKLNRYDY